MRHSYLYTGLSLSLAQLIGVFALLLGIAVLLQPKRFEKIVEEIMKTPALLFLIGFLNLLFGLLLITHHNVWQWNWPVIITLCGWLMTLRGVMVLFFPERVEKIAKYVLKNRWHVVGATIWILLGLILSWFGFFA